MSTAGISALRVVTVNGSYSTSSKTGALLELVTDTLADRLAIEVTRIELADLRDEFATALAPEDTGPRARAALDALAPADLVIAGTPVFKGSYSGLFKHFFDLLDVYDLATKPVLLVATGGSERHALVIEHALRPLFGFFQAQTAPVGIYVAAGDFDGTLVLNPEVHARIEIAVDDLVPVLELRRHHALGTT
ncbi:MAG TPA: NAD(P)H-dependent oxidoreductase [Amycolatopsis sp.]|nr:NAD(P)H-dependent oxidoreductase [Amycolatopsis sp.]